MKCNRGSRHRQFVWYEWFCNVVVGTIPCTLLCRSWIHYVLVVALCFETHQYHHVCHAVEEQEREPQYCPSDKNDDEVVAVSTTTTTHSGKLDDDDSCDWSNKNHDSGPHSDDIIECTLYIAESTIPNAGLGTFTSIPRRLGDPLGMGDVCFPYFRKGGGHSLAPPGCSTTTQRRTDLISDYVWDGSLMGMFRDEPMQNDVLALCPGLGCVVNSHAALINAHRTVPGYNPLLNRQVHSGAGAITPYHNATSKALRHIPAG